MRPHQYLARVYEEAFEKTASALSADFQNIAEEPVVAQTPPNPYKYRTRDALRHGLVHAVANPIFGSGLGATAASFTTTPDMESPRLHGGLVGAAAGAIPYAGLGAIIGNRYGHAGWGSAIGAGLGALGGGISGAIAGGERDKELLPYSKALAPGLQAQNRGVVPGASAAGQDPRRSFFNEVGDYVGRHDSTFEGIKGGAKLGLEAGMVGGLISSYDQIKKEKARLSDLVRGSHVDDLLNPAVRSNAYAHLKNSAKSIGKASLVGRAIAAPLGIAAGYHAYKAHREYELGQGFGVGAHSPLNPYTEEELEVMKRHRDATRSAPTRLMPTVQPPP